jgi:hypothetical protein
LKGPAEKAYADHLASLGEDEKPKPKVAIFGEVARTMLENESDEIKEEIEKYRQTVKNEPENMTMLGKLKAYQE